MLEVFHDPNLLGWELFFYTLAALGFLGFTFLATEAMYAFVLRGMIHRHQTLGKPLPTKTERIVPTWILLPLSFCALLTVMLGMIYIFLQHEVIANNLKHPESTQYEEVKGPFYRKIPE